MGHQSSPQTGVPALKTCDIDPANTLADVQVRGMFARQSNLRTYFERVEHIHLNSLLLMEWPKCATDRGGRS
jgi:hypothetical protein